MLDDMGMTKVLDFGVARSELDSRESETQELQFGSLEYMAPERLFLSQKPRPQTSIRWGRHSLNCCVVKRWVSARGRPERHTAFVDERLRHLVSYLGVQGMIASELESLLRSCLCFAHESRPLASEVSQKCRTLARIVDDDDLQTWSEQRLPAIIRLSEETETDDNPLLHTSVTEDSVLVRIDGAESEKYDVGPSAEDGDALRRGALADLTASLDVEPNPASGSGGPKYADLELSSDWDDEPTNVEVIPVRNDRSPLDVPTIPPLEEMEEPLMDATEVLSRKLKASTSLPLPISASEGNVGAIGPTTGNETPTEVVDATRLLELAAELQIEGTVGSDEREITETDTTLGPAESMDGGRKTVPLLDVIPPAKPEFSGAPSFSSGPSQEETRPLMGLGHAQPLVAEGIPSQSPPPEEPVPTTSDSEWTDPEVSAPLVRKEVLFLPY